MHKFFLNTYKNKKTRVLGESPAQDQTNDTRPSYIRHLYDEFLVKIDVHSKKKTVTTKNDQKID